MCAYKLIRLRTSSSIARTPSLSRDLRLDPVPIAPGPSYALHDDDDDDDDDEDDKDDVLLGTASAESEMQANLPHDLTSPVEHSSAFFGVLLSCARRKSRRGLNRNSGLTEFVESRPCLRNNSQFTWWSDVSE